MVPVDMTAIADVRERISAIQERMGLGNKVPGMDFDRALKKEMTKLQKTAEAASALPNNIRNTVAEARKKAETEAAKEQAAIAGGVISAHENTGGTLQSYMDEAAAKYNVDNKLLSAVAEVESGLNPDAISGAGAIGVMQLMPDTAASLGVNPYDTKQNIEGGAKYLRQMLDVFGGDVSKALAAYNAGPNAVKSYGGVPPYAETQNYVNRVLDIYR
ncbi:MAG: lytic transglycosylase domain-containing protein [Selenomonadaceae bacterium]|nr:lytic transglycosylase domain-containing protein [Selenomonadaceae bacterium]